MKRRDIEKIIAVVSVMVLGATPPTVKASVNEPFVIVLNERTETEEMRILSPQDKYELVLDEGLRIKTEREEAEREAERLRILEEERRAEEARIAEENRKDNVSVNLDNVLQVSNINTDELLAVFDYYPYAHNMKEIAWILVEAERTYGINAFVLAGIASWESDYNRSYRARFDNNVLGWGVYSSSAEGINASSKYENIMGATKFLREEYLTPGGLYFNGYTTWGLNQSYCLDANGNPDDAWRIGVNSIAKNYEWAYKNIVLK